MSKLASTTATKSLTTKRRGWDFLCDGPSPYARKKLPKAESRYGGPIGSITMLPSITPNTHRMARENRDARRRLVGVSLATGPDFALWRSRMRRSRYQIRSDPSRKGAP
jgi:hypothetical protein